MLGSAGVTPLVSAVAASSEQRAAAPVVHGAQVDSAIRAALVASRTGGLPQSAAASALAAARAPAVLATSLTAAHSFSADVHRARGGPTLVQIVQTAFQAADARVLAASGRGFDGSASGSGAAFGVASFASTSGSSLAMSGLADRTVHAGHPLAATAGAPPLVAPAAVVECPLSELSTASVLSTAGLTATLLGAFAPPAFRVEPLAPPLDPAAAAAGAGGAGFGVFSFGARVDNSLYSGLRYVVAQAPRAPAAASSSSAAAAAAGSDASTAQQVALNLCVRWPSLASRLLKLAVIVTLPAGAQLTARPLLEAARADLAFICRALDGCTSATAAFSSGSGDDDAAGSFGGGDGVPGPAVPGVALSPGFASAAQQLLDRGLLNDAAAVPHASDASLQLLAAASASAAASCGADPAAAGPSLNTADHATSVLLLQALDIESLAVDCEGGMLGVDAPLPDVVIEKLASGEPLLVNRRSTLRRATSHGGR